MEGMRWLEGQHHESEDPVTWVPLGWSLSVIFGAVAAAAMALPALPGYADGAVTSRTFFHPEWLVLATLLVLPVYRAARASWQAALLVVPVASVEVVYVADSAVKSLHEVGLTNPLYPGWYAVAFAQTALFVIVGATGARRCLADRRWVRNMRKLVALPPPDRGPSGPTHPARPFDPPRSSDNGFAA
jgi:hypothetical protein